MRRIIAFGAVENGRLALADRPAFVLAVAAIPDGPARLTLETGAKRSDRLNRYYWSVVIKVTAEYCGYLPDEMHEAWKLRLLRQEAPDHPLPTVRSTSTLTTAEFQRYIEDIRVIAATEFGVQIPEPNEAEA